MSCTKAQEEQHRPGAPEAGFELHSWPINDSTIKPHHGSKGHSAMESVLQQRPKSPDSSCLSCKSNESKDIITDFKREPLSPLSTDPSCSVLQQRPKSPDSSCLSCKSNESKDIITDFKREPLSPLSTDPSVLQPRRDSPEPTCLSVRSCQSKGVVTNLKSKANLSSAEQRVDLDDSGISMTPYFQQHQTDLDSIFKWLEHSLISFVKTELKCIQNAVCVDGTECFLNPWVEGAEDMQMGSCKKMAQEMILHFLKMNEDLTGWWKSDVLVAVCQTNLKFRLKEKFKCVIKGLNKVGTPTLLNQIYTELLITEGGTGGVNNEHEVRQIENAARKAKRQEISIRREDIFKPSPGRDGPIRTVMTKGVAGIGKTVLTQKFTLDWAENKTNWEIHLAFPFTFRDLNYLKGKTYSLVELVHEFFPETKEAGLCRFDRHQVVFIFDGLDECRLPLDFCNNKTVTDPAEAASLDVLLTNIIKGTLLPSARLWITTRPAAAGQIPADCVDRVTEVRGFTDPQKDEYFRKRLGDQQHARRIISHVKTSRSLHIMCHIPVFCWITAAVLEDVLTSAEEVELPKTLTEIYVHFLVLQMKLKSVKYDGGDETDSHWHLQSRELMERLGKLAFEQLQKGNVIFYESDVAECGIDVTAASVYTGMFTQIFKEEKSLYQTKVFCFIHLSVQEFLAALYVHLTFVKHNVNLLSKKKICLKWPKPDLKCLHQAAVDEALQSPNGHLDLFLRFLLGLSLQSNQTLLRGLLTQRESVSKASRNTVTYIKKKINANLSPERNINLLHCLNELKDSSLSEEIQQCLRAGSLCTDDLSPAQWSALVFILLSSEEDLDTFDLKKYSDSEEGVMMLLPVVKASRKALLTGRNLSMSNCKQLASILSSQSSALRELDLSDNNLEQPKMQLLSAGLGSPCCMLQTLRLSSCLITKEGCTDLASALQANPSHLKELDLSYNHLGDSGVMLLPAVLKDPHCVLQKLRLTGCNLSEGSCRDLSSVLSTQPSTIKDLDLSENNIQDSGLLLLSVGLNSPHCQVEVVRLSGCNLSHKSCEVLVSILIQRTTSLRELELNNNNLQDSGIELLSAALKIPQSSLQALRLSGCLITGKGCASLASSLNCSQLDLRELDLSYNHPGEAGRSQLSPFFTRDTLRLEPGGERYLRAGLTKYACEIKLDPNSIHRNLKLSDNNRKVTFVVEGERYVDHPDRFDKWSQLLCENALTGRCYWEVEWRGHVDMSVSYRGICRKGKEADCVFGMNDHSWSLFCSESKGFSVCHSRYRTAIPHSSPASNRVAVYLDFPAGLLSFYTVASGTTTHLHTFNATFTEALFAGFGLWSNRTGSSVSLSSLKEAEPGSSSDPHKDKDVQLKTIF